MCELSESLMILYNMLFHSNVTTKTSSCNRIVSLIKILIFEVLMYWNEGLILQLHAQYSADDDEYLAHRVVQAFDTAQFVDLTSGAAHLSVLAGDLNTEPEHLCHQLIRHTAQLTDTFPNHVRHLFHVHLFYT